MLKPEHLDHVPDSTVELYSQTELDILKNTAERINKYDYYIPAAQWQAKKLQAIRMMHHDILKGLSSISGKSEKLAENKISRHVNSLLTQTPSLNQNAILTVTHHDYTHLIQ